MLFVITAKITIENENKKTFDFRVLLSNIINSLNQLNYYKKLLNTLSFKDIFFFLSSIKKDIFFISKSF